MRYGIFIFILFPAWFASNQSYAGHSVGGGGTGVVCHDANEDISSIEIYDYFYARKLGRDINLGPSNETYQTQAQVALDRLAKLSPLRAKKYADQIRSFESPQEANFLKDTSIFHVPDLGQPVLDPGPGCELVQIVFQQEPRFSRDKRYLINEFYWKLLNQTQKAGLVLHEVIYREAMSYGQNDSSGAREFNITFSEESSTKMTFQEFYAMLRAIPFVETDFLGNQTVIGTCIKSPENSRPSCQSPNDIETWLEAEFYDSGNLKKVRYPQGFSSLRTNSYLVVPKDAETKIVEIGFYDTASPVLQAIKAKGGFKILSSKDGTFHQGPYAQASFHMNGQLQVATSFYTGAALPDKKSVNGQVWFTDSGHLLKAQLTGTREWFGGLKYKNYPLLITGEGEIIFQDNGSWQTKLSINLTVAGAGGQTEISTSQYGLEHDLSFRANGSLEKANGDRAVIRPNMKGICIPKEMRSDRFPPPIHYSTVRGMTSFYENGTLASGSVTRDLYRDICLKKNDGTEEEWSYRSYQGKTFTFDTEGFWTGLTIPQ